MQYRILDPVTEEVVATLRLDREANQADADAWLGARSSTGGAVALELSEGVYLNPTAPAAPDPIDGLDRSLQSSVPIRRAQIDRLKAQVATALIANLMAQGQSADEAQAETMTLGAQFYDSHGGAILSYIDGSGYRLRSQIAADGRPWLEYSVPGGAGSIRDLFMSTLPVGETGDRCILTDAEVVEIASLMDGTLTMSKIKEAFLALMGKLQ